MGSRQGEQQREQQRERQRERQGGRRRPGRLLVLATLALLFSVGCSNSTGDSNSARAEAGRGGPATDEAAAIAADGADASSAGGEAGAEGVGTGADLLETGAVRNATVAATRDQVFTATLDVEVGSLRESLDDAATAVEALGGFAANEDLDLGRSSNATITYRVPAEQFRPALKALSKLGTLTSQRVNAEDVTAQYADLEGRVTTLRTSIARLQGFLGEATDANQIASLEGELTRREAELESTEAQRRSLADQVDLSTITVSYTGTTVSEPLDDTRELPTFLGGLEAGWDFFVGAAAVVLTALGFIAPLLLPAAALVVLVRWVMRRRQPATPAETAA